LPLVVSWGKLHAIFLQQVFLVTLQNIEPLTRQKSCKNILLPPKVNSLRIAVIDGELSTKTHRVSFLCVFRLHPNTAEILTLKKMAHCLDHHRVIVRSQKRDFLAKHKTTLVTTSLC
jgi:hypothetical protein